MDDSLSNALDEDPTVDAVVLDANESIFPPNLNSQFFQQMMISIAPFGH